MRKPRNRVVVWLEICVVLAIICVLAFISLPAYQDYTIRAYVSEVMYRTGPLKVAVAEYYQKTLAFPSVSSDLGPPSLTEVADPHGRFGASIGASGHIEAWSFLSGQGDKNEERVVMHMAPGIDASGELFWTCRVQDLRLARYAPASCRE